MDMQLRRFTNRTIGRMELSNYITDNIAICINDDMQMQSAYFMFLMIFLILTFLLIFMKNANVD